MAIATIKDIKNLIELDVFLFFTLWTVGSLEKSVVTTPINIKQPII